MAGGRAVGKSLTECFLETIICSKLKLGREISWGCRCITSWCDLDLTFDLAVVTLTFKILSGLYLRNHKTIRCGKLKLSSEIG